MWIPNSASAWRFSKHVTSRTAPSLALQNEAGHCYSQVTGKETQTLGSYCDHPWSLDWWSKSGFLISLSFKLQMALPRRAALWQRTRKVTFMLGFEEPVFRGLEEFMLRSPSRPHCWLQKSAVLGSRCILLPVSLAQHSHFSLHLVSVQLPDCLYSTNRPGGFAVSTVVLLVHSCLRLWLVCGPGPTSSLPLENRGRRMATVLAGGVAHKPPPGSTHNIPRYHEK